MIQLKTIIYILIWGILFAGYPFVFTYMFGYPNIIVILGLTAMLALICIKQNVYLDKKYGILLFATFVFFIYAMIYHENTLYLSNIVQVFVIYVIFTALTKMASVEGFSKQFIYVIAAIAVLGAIGSILVYSFGLDPLFKYVQQDGREANAYFLTVTNTPGPPLPHPIIRYSGYFDEPGALAFFSMIALCLNRLYLRNKKIENALLIAPLLTFSMAHIITAVCFCLFFRMKKMWHYILSFACVLGVVVAIYSLKDSEYGRLYELSIERFEMDDGDVKGNNRVNISDTIEAFVDNPIMGVGIDEDSSLSDNPFSILAQNGIIGYIIIQITFFYILLRTIISKSRNKWDVLKCLILLFMNLQQRPFRTNIVYFTAMLLLFMMSENFIKPNKQYAVLNNYSLLQ